MLVLSSFSPDTFARFERGFAGDDGRGHESS
jgi:hypothetical protein